MPPMRYDNTFVYPSSGFAGRLANRIVASGPLLRARRALRVRDTPTPAAPDGPLAHSQRRGLTPAVG